MLKVNDDVNHLSIFFSFFFVELSLFFSGGVLVLLVLGDEVVHVTLSLSELHLIHALTSVPVEESLSSEHSGELLADPLEELLDGSAVSDEGGRHLETSGRNVTDGGLDIVGDPFDEVAAVLVLYVQHLLINLLHGHTSSEHSSHGQVSAVSGVAGSHHVLGIEHLGGELGDGQSSVLLRTSAGQRSKSGDEEVETGEGNHIDCEFPEISVQLAREPQAGGDTRHGGGDEMVKISISGGGQFQGSETDIVESLVVNGEGLIGVLYQLVDREGGVVRLDNCVGDLGGRYYGESSHDPVGVFLTDLGDKEGSHSGSSSTTKRVGQLESLKTVAAFSFLSDYVKDRVDELSSLGVVSLGPVVSSSRLSENEVVGSVDLSERSRSDRVHGAGFQINKDGTGDIFSSGGLVVVDIDPLELEVRVSVVGSSWVNAMLVRDDLPEFGSDLVAALASLQVNNFSHVE